MSFHINSCDLPPLRCYNDALSYWERIKPWRGDSDTNTRPIAGRNKRGQTIRKLNDGAIAMRLYHTDVVVYHPDGSITLTGHPSVSTDAFARALTPYHVSTIFNSGAGLVVYLHGRAYLMSEGTLRIARNEKDEWRPVDMNETKPFRKYVVNTKRKNAEAKYYNVSDFKSWLKARKVMGEQYAGYYWGYNADHAQLRERLRSTENWEGIYKEFGESTEAAVNDAILSIDGCIEVVKLTYVNSYNEINAVIASHRKYAHVMKGK